MELIPNNPNRVSEPISRSSKDWLNLDKNLRDVIFGKGANMYPDRGRPCKVLNEDGTVIIPKAIFIQYNIAQPEEDYVILELPDGRIHNCEVKFIRFVDNYWKTEFESVDWK